jgi:hypothetical protein
VAAVLAAGLLAACSSGSGGVVAPPTATPVPASSSAPSPSTSSATASPSPTALSAFEGDPAVKALRMHYVGLAKLVNARSDKVPELRRTSTTERLKVVVGLFRPEFGDRYPGPIPFTPLGVTHDSASRTRVVYCVLSDGWLQDPKTGKPTLPRKVEHGVATVTLSGGSWKVTLAERSAGSCAGVQIPEVEFP